MGGRLVLESVAALLWNQWQDSPGIGGSFGVEYPRRLRIEHVNSSVKRCRIVKDRIRLWKEGVRDLVMELCCALHNFRVRLTPWRPMI
jgi:hypothetical protein